MIWLYGDPFFTIGLACLFLGVFGAVLLILGKGE